MCDIGIDLDKGSETTLVVDMCSGLFTAAIGVGDFIGPFLGGVLVQYLGF